MSEPSPIPEQSRLFPRPSRARERPWFDPRLVITAALFIAIIGLAICYLLRPEPLLVQGQSDSARIDIAARVSGRLMKIAVARGQKVEAGATLLVIDNPELVAELHQAEAEKLAQLRRFEHFRTPKWLRLLR